MNKLILIRYAEIHLKGRNIGFFESTLLKNIKKALSFSNAKISQIRGRYLVEDFEEEMLNQIVSKLKKVCGIHNFSVADVVDSDLSKIKECALSQVNFQGTFKIVTNRADKKFPLNSMEVSREVGGYVLENTTGISVDVVSPQNVISIDIRENGKTFIYTKTTKGVGGLPCGTSTKGILLLSGGIDSPVAGYMMAKRGMDLNCLNFFSYPYTGEQAKEKVVQLAKELKDFNPNLTLNIVHFTEIQEEIHKICNGDYMIALMRRFMMRIAERFALRVKAKALITGENLGQVASQTVESMTSSQSVVTMPIFRPVIGFDKLEIIEIAKLIDTYDTSILPYEDCCTVFLPKNPVIKPKLEDMENEEGKLDVEGLIERAMSRIERVSLED